MYGKSSYSPAGAARRYQVSLNVVRRWISAGLVPARLQPYERYTRVWWLQIDDATDARLRQLAPRTKGYRPNG